MECGDMNFRYENGVVLILALIFLAAISYLSLHMMIKSLLVVKTVAGFEKQLLTWIEAKNQLLMMESAIQKDPQFHQDRVVAFVPDHLEFGCEEGVQIFKVEESFLQSFVAVRW